MGDQTHDTIEGKDNHNHHDRTYHIHITKTERVVSRQDIKPTQISAEQYLCEQLHKHTKTDPLENILTQLEKQPAASNINNNIYNGPHRNNTQTPSSAQRKGQ